MLLLLPSVMLSLPLKGQGNAIHTMPLIRRPAVALPFKHMTQMAATIRTDNLRPAHAQAPILPPINGTRHTFEEGRPPATAVELARAPVQLRVAAGASVDSGGGVVVVGAAIRAFGAAGTEDAELFRGEDRTPFVVGFLDWRVCVCGHFVGGLVGGRGAEV